MTWRSLSSLGPALVVVVAIAGCGDDSPTSPTTSTATTTTTIPADATVSEDFTGALPVGGARFFSFDVAASGTVVITLRRVGGVTGVPSTIWVGLGVGVPEATDCVTTTSISTQAGDGPHISTTLTPGTYCARVYDIGNLAATAPFAITIAHP